MEPGFTVTNGMVELKVKSWKGFGYDIEASNDLNAWARVTTLTNETGLLPFNDPTASERRFYRLVSR